MNFVVLILSLIVIPSNEQEGMIRQYTEKYWGDIIGTAVGNPSNNIVLNVGFDLNGARYAVISTIYDGQYNTGNDWRIVRFGSGICEQVQFQKDSDQIYCKPYDFFKVDFDSGESILLVDYNIWDKNDNDEWYVQSNAFYRVSLDQRGRIFLHDIPGGWTKILGTPGYKSRQRLYKKP